MDAPSLVAVPRDAVAGRTVLIVNAQSRRGETLFEEARAKLEAAGVRLAAAHAVREPGRMRETMRAAVRSGAGMVIVGGGDGSLSCVVDDVVGRDVVFAVLPLGTANSFARSMGLPLDLDGAVAAIAAGKHRRIDLGVVGDDYFVNAGSVGLATDIAESVPAWLKRWFGRAGYLAWAAWCFVRFRPFELVVEDGDATHRLWTTEVRVFNGRFHGGVELGESAGVGSGDIVVQAVAGRGKGRLARDWYAKFFKLRSRAESTVEFRGRELRLDTVPARRMSVDGEVGPRMPVTVRVAPRAIEVVAP